MNIVITICVTFSFCFVMFLVTLFDYLNEKAGNYDNAYVRGRVAKIDRIKDKERKAGKPNNHPSNS